MFSWMVIGDPVFHIIKDDENIDKVVKKGKAHMF